MPGDVTRPTTLPPRRPVEKWTGRGGGGQSSQVVGARRIDGRQSVEREREREREKERKLSRQLAWWRAPASWISSRKWRSYSEPRIWEREKMKSGACWPASSSGRSSSSSSVALPASRDSTVLPISSRLPWPLDSPLPPWLRYCHPLSNWQLFRSILNPPIRINRPGFDCLGLFVRDPQSLPSSLFNPRWFESMRSGDVSGFWRDLVSFVHPLIPSPPLPLRVDSSCLLIDFLGVVWFIPSPRSEWEYFRLIRLRVVTGSSKGAGHATASSFLYLKLTNRSSSLNQLIKTD